MRVCFACVGENSVSYLNMMKLLIFSIRQNAAKLKSSQILLVTNGQSISEDEQKTLARRFGHLKIKTMPRLGATPYTNKFNAFYAMNPKEYDVLVLVDCDVVVLREFDHIFENLDTNDLSIKASGYGPVAASKVKGYDLLIRRHCGFTDSQLSTIQDATSRLGYPVFSSGLVVLTSAAVSAIREDAIRLTYRIYEDVVHVKGKPTNLRYRLGKLRQAVMHPVLQARKPIRFPIWMSEQLGLSMAVLKHELYYEKLSKDVHSTSRDLINGELPCFFHYPKDVYDIPRDKLFDGAWVNHYLASDSSVEREFAKLAKSYAE